MLLPGFDVFKLLIELRYLSVQNGYLSLVISIVLIAVFLPRLDFFWLRLRYFRIWRLDLRLGSGGPGSGIGTAFFEFVLPGL